MFLYLKIAEKANKFYSFILSFQNFKRINISDLEIDVGIKAGYDLF